MSDNSELKSAPKDSSCWELGSFIFAFLTPTLIGKALVLYFGSNYSNHPGEGYGWGLIFAILFTLTMVARFIWKYRNYED